MNNYYQQIEPRRNGQVLKTKSLPRLGQQETDHLNRSITRSKIESIIIKYSRQTRIQDQITSLGNSTKHTLKNLYLLKLFQEIEEERTLPNPFYEATITQIPKPDKDATKKENYRPFFG